MFERRFCMITQHLKMENAAQLAGKKWELIYLIDQGYQFQNHDGKCLAKVECERRWTQLLCHTGEIRVSKRSLQISFKNYSSRTCFIPKTYKEKTTWITGCPFGWRSRLWSWDTTYAIQPDNRVLIRWPIDCLILLLSGYGIPIENWLTLYVSVLIQWRNQSWFVHWRLPLSAGNEGTGESGVNLSEV